MWIADPKTYKKSRVNTRGWMVTSLSREGTRGMVRRPRPTSRVVSRTKRCRRAGRAGRASARAGSTTSRIVVVVIG